MSAQNTAFKTGLAGANLHRFNGSVAVDTWLDEVQLLADRFSCVVPADMATMSKAQLWALHAFLKAKMRSR